MAKKDRIPKDDFADLQTAMLLLSKLANEMLEDVTGNEVLSTNFVSGIRGAELVYKTIEGVVGSAKTAPAWDLLEPLVEKWTPSKEQKAKPLPPDIAADQADVIERREQQVRAKKAATKRKPTS